MKYNPKVVSIDRSAAYVHHRAMKNRRANNPVDALELMRHAVEHSPENREYKLDLAELYCEMGCHEQSNRILLDMLADRDAPAECYYGLALNQLGCNNTDSARQALRLYQWHADDDEYIEDAYGLSAEIELVDVMDHDFPPDRKTGRAAQIAGHACDAMKVEDFEKARRLFERSLEMCADQPEMRALYAMTLNLMDEKSLALEQAEKSADTETAPHLRALCVAAQVFWMNGEKERAEETILRVIDAQPDGVELRLLIYALGEMEMPDRAAEAIKRALRESPYDKMLLHLRAVALHKSGAPDAQVEPFWLRILRIDPDDTVAAYYHACALKGELSQHEPEYFYQVPDDEFRRRLKYIAEMARGGLTHDAELWRTDREFRSMLLWALDTGEESCSRLAVIIIAAGGDAESESILREVLYRTQVPLSIKRNAMLILKVLKRPVQRFLPPGINAKDGFLPPPDDLLDGLPVGERQLVRYTDNILECRHYGVSVMSALAVMWQTYREKRGSDAEPMTRTQEAAGALAWNYMRRHGEKLEFSKVAKMFDCGCRRMAYYARRMQTVLERDRGGIWE